MIRFDLDQMRAFLAVVDTGGFTAAGNRLGLTQSAVSLKLRKLEEAVGQPLLDRTTRSVALTDAGTQLLGYARRLLALHDEAVVAVRGEGAAGRLRIGLVEHFAAHRLPQILMRCRARFPALKLEVQLGHTVPLVDEMAAGRLDMVIGLQRPEKAASRLVLRDPVVWAAAADFPLDPDARLPLALLSGPCKYRTWALDALNDAGRGYDVVYSSSGLVGLQAAVLAGLAVAAFGRSSVAPGMVVLGPEVGLPPLPVADLGIYGEANVDPALVDLVLTELTGPAMAGVGSAAA